MTGTPCQAEPDAFTREQFSAKEIDRLASTYCDACPIRGECYRTALRDDSAWGVFGGVLMANGVPVPASHASVRRPSRKSIPMRRAA